MRKTKPESWIYICVSPYKEYGLKRLKFEINIISKVIKYYQFITQLSDKKCQSYEHVLA